MKTKDKPEIASALQDADDESSNTMGHFMFAYYLGKALVLAVCEVADGINQIMADLPSRDN